MTAELVPYKPGLTLQQPCANHQSKTLLTLWLMATMSTFKLEITQIDPMAKAANGRYSDFKALQVTQCFLEPLMATGIITIMN
jgi:hypothetical protein